MVIETGKLVFFCLYIKKVKIPIEFLFNLLYKYMYRYIEIHDYLEGEKNELYVFK